jgi:type II secretory pathway component PulF
MDELLQKIQTRLDRLRFGTAKQQGFLEDLSALIADGVPPNRAIDMLSEISSGIVRKVALGLSRTIGEGQPLSDGMKFYFGVNVAALVQAGEAGGVLGETIEAAAKEIGKKSGATKAVIGAIMYPTVVNIMGWGVIIYINMTVFQDFLKIRPLSEWPPVGQFFVEYGNFLIYWWWTIFAVIGLIYFVIMQILKRTIGPIRVVLDKFPIFTLFRQVSAAQFMETMGMLVGNGVVFKEALGIIQMSAPIYVGWHVGKMEDLLTQGFENIADVLNTGMIEDESIARLRIVAEAKGFDHALVRLGRFASEKAEGTIRTAAKAFSGVLLLVGGGQIGLIIKAIYSVGMSLGQAS